MLNIYTPVIGTLNFIKENQLTLNPQTNHDTAIAVYFNIPLSWIGMLEKEVPVLNDIINQMDLSDIRRTFYPKNKEYTIFSAAQGTIS